LRAEGINLVVFAHIACYFLYKIGDVIMAIVSQSEFRANMAKLLDQVEDDSKELIVTRTGGKEHMVVIPLGQYESWKETEYLMSNPANAAAIREGIAQLDRGEGIEVTIDELRGLVRVDEGKAA
jgi:antitoxin YefM